MALRSAANTLPWKSVGWSLISVLGDRGVDVSRPGRDAAFEVVYVGEARPQQLLGGVSAARSVVAVERDGRLLVEGREVLLAVVVELLGLGDRRQGPLAVGTHIEELDVGGVEERLDRKSTRLNSSHLG